MDFVSLQIAVIAVLSPILLAAGILHLITASNIGVISGIVLNLLAAVIGGLRFALDLPDPYSGLLTLLFVFFLILALIANGRFCHRFWTTLSSPPVPARAKSPDPRPAAPVRTFANTVPKKDGAKRVQIVSPTTWLLHNDWGDIRVYTVPPAIIEKKNDLPASDRRFRIIYDEDEEAIEDTFTISHNFQILLPPEHLDRLKGKELIRFEIVE